MKAKIEQALVAKTRGARTGMLLALRNTLDVSNTQVPHEEGDLERDGGVSLDEITLHGVISYGRSADTKDYAVVQHEDMTLKHDSGRNAKFLENAMNATRGENLDIIKTSVKREMRA